jgi:hypothetical protein
MVETGSLAASLSDPSGFFQAMTAQEVVFGTPQAIEEELKARYNWRTRQTIFLGIDDQRMIDQKVQSYLSLGPEFERIRFAQGMERVQDREAEAKMDVDFGGTMGG